MVKRSVAPGPRGRRLLGSLLEVRRDPLQFVLRITREHGDLVRFRMGRRQLFLLNHPDHFRHVLHNRPSNYHKGLGLSHASSLFGNGLLTSDGQLWATQRHHLQQAFGRDRMERYAESMVDASEAMLERWARAEPATPLDIPTEMARLTLDILERTLLRLDLGGASGELVHRFDTITRWAMRRMIAPVEIPPSFPTPANLRARSALRALDTLVFEWIANRRRQSVELGDVLDLLLRTVPPVGEQQIRDEIMTLLLAGHETGAAALAWIWYLLARHPKSRTRLQDELQDVLGGRRPTLADMPRLPVTRRVIEESLRLYPPVWMLPRRAIDRDEIGGYDVPAGSDVLLSVYSMHRHLSFWEAPEDFRPERFDLDRRASGLSHSYLPFGSGPRSCLGRFFGTVELQMVLATMAQQVELQPLSDAPVEAEPLLTLRPRPGLWMRATPRSGMARSVAQESSVRGSGGRSGS